MPSAEKLQSHLDALFSLGYAPRFDETPLCCGLKVSGEYDFSAGPIRWLSASTGQGWSRGAKSPKLALETLESYRERYRPIAGLAGMARKFAAAGPLEIVEDKVGSGSTDFWGISFSPAATEQGPMAKADLERGITILQACWVYVDDVAARVSPEMRKGPRGGGRDRHTIVRHTIRTESEQFAKHVGIRMPEEAALTPDGLRDHRETFVAALRAYNAGEVERRMRSWTLPFLIRHSAFHVLDHAWEMEDKDLSAEGIVSRR